MGIHIDLVDGEFLDLLRCDSHFKKDSCRRVDARRGSIRLESIERLKLNKNWIVLRERLNRTDKKSE
jgi:hypothetical protein